MWNGRTVAVVLPTYRERNSIAAVVKGFEALGIVDDIVVVNNNAEHGTSEEVGATSAREIFESTQGYGSAIQRGLREVDADLICVCEPDATFGGKFRCRIFAKPRPQPAVGSPFGLRSQFEPRLVRRSKF